MFPDQFSLQLMGTRLHLGNNLQLCSFFFLRPSQIWQMIPFQIKCVQHTDSRENRVYFFTQKILIVHFEIWGLGLVGA